MVRGNESGIPCWRSEPEEARAGAEREEERRDCGLVRMKEEEGRRRGVKGESRAEAFGSCCRVVSMAMVAAAALCEVCKVPCKGCATCLPCLLPD